MFHYEMKIFWTKSLPDKMTFGMDFLCVRNNLGIWLHRAPSAWYKDIQWMLNKMGNKIFWMCVHSSCKLKRLKLVLDRFEHYLFLLAITTEGHLTWNVKCNFKCCVNVCVKCMWVFFLSLSYMNRAIGCDTTYIPLI